MLNTISTRDTKNIQTLESNTHRIEVVIAMSKVSYSLGFGVATTSKSVVAVNMVTILQFREVRNVQVDFQLEDHTSEE